MCDITPIYPTVVYPPPTVQVGAAVLVHPVTRSQVDSHTPVLEITSPQAAPPPHTHTPPVWLGGTFSVQLITLLVSRFYGN